MTPLSHKTMALAIAGVVVIAVVTVAVRVVTPWL